MMKTISLGLFLCAAAVLAGAKSYGQADTSQRGSYESLSLKDLLNVKIVSASKKQELLFEAPLSASVVTKEDIHRAGSSSIMEAMRLVPGMIVREQSNGNYDIHLRGMDNVPQNAPFDLTSNTTTLVMIDGRPVYSYLRGGTFWETLPIDLNDVERIEVVRGPAAALYGPNAVNGVINIITRQLKKDGLYLAANARQGSYHTFINNISTGYRYKNWGVIASGNYQGRQRTQTSYFEYYRNKWLQDPDYLINFNGDTSTNVEQRYPDKSLAMEKYAGNVFVSFDPTEKLKLNLATGIQHSMAQRVSTENEATPLSTTSSDSRYVDFRANINGWAAQVSYNAGTQVTDYGHERKYDFHVFNGNLEYSYTKGRFSLKPGLSYANAIYDDTKYSDWVNKTGLLNARGQITTKSASLRSEYRLFDNRLRLVAGAASYTFNHPDTHYWSYQFAATYKLSKRHLLRAVYSRAPRSSTIFDMYVSKAIDFYPIGNNSFARVELQANRDIKLLNADMIEAGYRGNLAAGLTVDVELFNIHAKNYNTLVTGRPYIKLNGTDTIQIIPIRSTNLPMELYQRGLTVSVTYTSRKWRVNPFATWQHTEATNYAPFINTPDAGTPNAMQNNIYSGMGTKEELKSTPRLFGGASVNYMIAPKVNVNLSAYYYSSQTYYHLSNILFNDGVRGIDHIDAKLLVNANISYEVTKRLKLSCSGKNLLNDKSREFFGTDDVPFMLMGGINYEF